MWLIFEKFIWENAVDVATFPVWWYGRGLKEAILRFTHAVSKSNQFLGFTLWAANIFTPMFAQRDWQGRVISFFMRLVQIIARGTAFIILLIIFIVFLFAWALSLPFAAFLLLNSVLRF